MPTKLILVWALLLGADSESAPAPCAESPDEAGVFSCNFDASWDPNYDGWPSDWTRRAGPGFPRYVRIEIDPVGPPSGGRSLRIDVDGAAAAAQSPLISVDPLFEYVLHVAVQAENVGAARARISLWLFDENRRPIQRISSNELSETARWRTASIGPAPLRPEARSAMIALEVLQGGHPSSGGRIRFADIRLMRVPHFRLDTVKSRRLFIAPEPLRIECTAAGRFDSPPEAELVVVDQIGREIVRDRLSLKFHSQGAKSHRTSPRTSSNSTNPQSSSGSVEGAVTTSSPGIAVGQWTVPKLLPGWYRVRSMLWAGTRFVSEKQISIAVVEQFTRDNETPFGWSLPRADRPAMMSAWEHWIDASGVGWVKLPLWIDSRESDDDVAPTADAIDHLEQRGVRIIGVLDRPPQAVARRLSNGTPLPTLAEVITADPSVWGASLTETITRFSMQVPYWQLGSDDDTSLIGSPTVFSRVRTVVELFERLAPNAALGLPWDSTFSPPRHWPAPTASTDTKGAPAFVSLSSRPPLSAAELAWLLAEPPSSATAPGSDRTGGGRRWRSPGNSSSLESQASAAQSLRNGTDSNGRAAEISAPSISGFIEMPPEPRSVVVNRVGPKRGIMLYPLPAERYDNLTRWIDYTARMITAKVYAADWIFAGDALEPSGGMFDESGDPTPLFLLWRTAACLIGGAEYLGRLDLPGESVVYLFARGDSTVLVVRRSEPGRDSISIPTGSVLFDAWGKRRPTVGEGLHAVDVGPLPLYLVGVPSAVARWQLDAVLERGRLPAEFDKPHANAISVVNSFSQGVFGRVRIVPPDDWGVQPREADFRLAGGETWRLPFELRIPATASHGRKWLRFDFELEAGRSIRLSLYRPLDIGLGDVMIELTGRIDAHGRLEVIQRTINETDRPVSFRCELFIPDRRSMRSQVIGLGRGQDVKTYLIEDGQELQGRQLWLRAEEIDGARVLNYRFHVGHSENPARKASAPDPTDHLPGTTRGAAPKE